MSRVGEIPAPVISNVVTEWALLGGLMMANNAIDGVAAMLGPEHFAEPAAARVFSAIVREHDLGRKATPITLLPYFAEDPVFADLGGAQSFLADLTGSGAAVIGIKSFAEQVRTLADRRQLAERLTHVARAAEDYEVGLDELASQAEGAIADALAGTPGTVSLSASGAIEAALDSMFDGVAGVMCKVIPSLDHALGAIAPGDLVILAGRPGMAKTGVALTYSRGVASQGHGVAFASLEMRAAQLGGRLAADICFDGPKVPYRAISQCDASVEERRHIARAALAIRELPLWIEDLPSATVGRLGAIVRKHKRKFAMRNIPLKLLVVDYLQLLSADGRVSGILERVSEVSRGLKALAKAEDIGILALCQLSREVEKREDKRPILSDLRESGQIEQDADAICFLLRREEYAKRKEPPDPESLEWQSWREEFERVRGRIEFIVAKRRSGDTGTGHGFWHGAYQAVRG